MSEPITELHLMLDLVGGERVLATENIPVGCQERYVPAGSPDITVAHVFHTVMHSIDADWPWFVQKNEVSDLTEMRCPDCGGMIYRGPTTGVETWQRLAQQIRTEMKVPFALGVKFVSAGDKCSIRKAQLAAQEESAELDRKTEIASDIDDDGFEIEKTPLAGGVTLIRRKRMEKALADIEEAELMRMSGMTYDEWMTWKGSE